MKGALQAFWRIAKAQILSQKRPTIWTAYTHSGKVVVIEGDRVVKVVDPAPKGRYAK